MYNRKKIKKQAKAVVKHHYFLLVIFCLIAGVLGSEYSGITTLWTQNTEDTSAEVEKIQSSQIIGISAPLTDVIDNIVEGDFEGAKQIAEASKQSYETEKDTTDNHFGHTEGVLSTVVNSFLSGSVVITLVTSITNITTSTNIALALIIVVALFIYLLYHIFVVDYFKIVIRRVTLEAGTYKKVPVSHAFMSHAIRKNFKAALAYLRCTIYLLLWWCTIIGGIIKSFSYAMVPYILAENPDISGRDAITLSRKMMKGHKWQLFTLYLSMFWWYVLDFFTVGIAGIVFLNPYLATVEAKYYEWLRSDSKKKDIENIELLNDTYLYEIADDETLSLAYSDVEQDEKYLKEHPIKISKVQKFFATNFSLWIGSTAKKKHFQAIENLKHTISNDHDALDKKIYPVRLNPSYKPSIRKGTFAIQYIRCYTIWTLILFFFLFSFVGWAWEVTLMLVTLGKFVNRGIMFGPWLPIYGTGGIVALLLLARLRKNPPACFFGAIVLSGILEYSTSWFLEMQYHTKWWDYTGYFLNLDGRICAEGLLVFGVGCSLVIYLVAPLFDSFVSKKSPKIIIPLSVILLALFGVDAVYSHFHPNAGEGVTSSIELENTYYVSKELSYDIS
jgi:uncharacterized membrane protein